MAKEKSTNVGKLTQAQWSRWFQGLKQSYPQLKAIESKNNFVEKWKMAIERWQFSIDELDHAVNVLSVDEPDLYPRHIFGAIISLISEKRSAHDRSRSRHQIEEFDHAALAAQADNKKTANLIDKHKKSIETASHEKVSELLGEFMAQRWKKTKANGNACVLITGQLARHFEEHSKVG